MRIIIIDGFHKGHVIDWHLPTPEIKLLKPRTVTVCDCDNPSALPPRKKKGEKFEYDSEEITYRVAFTSRDADVALFSTSGRSMDIFDSGFDRVFRERPYGPHETLYFGCHDYNAFRWPLRGYAADPIKRCLHSLTTSMELLHMSMRGVSAVSNFPKMDQRLIDLTIECGQEVTDEMRTRLAESQRVANFADGEIKGGFPFLHAFATVAAWAALEVAIEDCLVGILLNEPEVLQREEIAKVRLPLAKYEALDREERMRFLVSEISRARSTAAGQGVATSESLLGVFDLSGKVEEDVGKLLWEMNHVRNVIVHRDSVADQRIVQSCPWLNLKPGDRVLVNHEKFGDYAYAVARYVVAVEDRLRRKYGVPVPERAKAPEQPAAQDGT